MGGTYLGNASCLSLVVVRWWESEKPWWALQKTARHCVISLAWLPVYGDRIYRGMGWLGEYYVPSWLGSSPPPELASSGVDQKVLQWARIVGSRKYSQLGTIYKWWGAVFQISKITDDLNVLYFWFWNASHFFTADFPSYERVAYIIKISWHFPSPQMVVREQLT